MMISEANPMLSNTITGVGLGATATVAMVVAEIAVTGTTQINLREAVAVGSVLCGAVWYMGRKFTRIDDRLDTIEKSIKSLPCHPTDPTCPRKDDTCA